MSCVDRAFGDGIVPASRTPKPFQKPTHPSGPFEIDPGAAYSIRQTIAATTPTADRDDERPELTVPCRPGGRDEQDHRREHVADPGLRGVQLEFVVEHADVYAGRREPFRAGGAGRARSPGRAASGIGRRRSG